MYSKLKKSTPLAVFLLAFLFIPLAQLGTLSRMPGDVGDARLNNYFLENLYQFFIGGSSSFWHLSFFFPFPYVLGFSDNLFGSSPVYVLARLFNANADTAYQIWFLFGYVVNFGASYYALRRLNFSVMASTVGALIFTFALPTAAHVDHAQLHYRFGLPLSIIFFAEFLNGKSWRCLLISGAWLVWQFYAGVYMGFFTLLLLTTMSLAYLGYALICGQNLLKNLFVDLHRGWCSQSRMQKIIFFGCLVLLLVLLLVLFYPYLQVTRLYGAKRSWNEIASMLPRPQSYLLSDHSVWWAFKDASIFAGIPMRHEHQMFMGFFPLVLAFAGFLVGIREKNNLIFALMTGMLGIAVIVTLYVGDVSLWYLLHQLPLASAIRAMTRLDQAFLFPIAYLAAIAMDKFKVSCVWGGKAAYVLILPLLISEAAMTSMPLSSKESWRHRFTELNAAVPKNLPDNAILFFAQRSGPPYADELDAMWVSLSQGKKTMNGYSGLYPPLYDYEFGSDCAQIPRRVISYLRFSGQSEDVVTYRDLMSRVVPIGFSNCNLEWWKSPLSVTSSDRVYTPEEFRALSLTVDSVEKGAAQVLVRFTITNPSGIPFSAASSLGKPIRISWRFIDSDGRPMSGWDMRKGVPFDIPAHGKLHTYISFNQLGNDVAMGVQISLVFWGHDVGVQPLTVRLR